MIHNLSFDFDNLLNTNFFPISLNKIWLSNKNTKDIVQGGWCVNVEEDTVKCSGGEQICLLRKKLQLEVWKDD